MGRTSPSRVLTVVAVGFLLLDASLLILAGIWSNRTVLVAWGAIFGVAAVVVFVYWRRHLRRMDELSAEINMRSAELMQLKRDLENQSEP